MTDEKTFEKIYKECQCAGTGAAGNSAIINFAPENVAGIENIGFNDSFEKVYESRALPGGMLNSKEKTDYENNLIERQKKFDKSKSSVEVEGNLAMFNSDAGANGIHDYDGSLK